MEWKNKILKFWPILVIFLLVAIFASPYWVRGRVPFPASHLVTAFPPWQYYYGMPVKNNAMPDVVTQMYPWKHLVIGLWKSRQLPLWNPYNFSGNPLLANYQSAIFHPANFLFFILPEVDAWSFLILLQPLLAGLFTYLFCRQLRLGRGACLLSAIAFMFCGFLTVWMAYGTLSYALLWLPLVLYAIEKNFLKLSPFSLVLVSFSLVASFFSGHFQTSLYVFLAALSFLIFRLIVSREIKTFLFCLLFVVLGFSLASIQIFPTLELYQFSVRSKFFGASEVIPWRYLITLIAPDFYGNPVTRNDWFGHYAEWAGFIGVIPLILAVYATIRKKDYYVWFFALLGGASLILTLPTPLLDLLIRLKIPVLSSSAVSRIISLFSFSGAVLAGFGLDQLVKDLDKRKFKPILLFSSAVLIFILGAWGILVVQKPFESKWLLVAKRNFILPTGMVVTVFGLILGYWLMWRIFRNKRLITNYLLPITLSAILLLTACDLLRFAKKWMPFDSKEHIYPPLPILEFLTQTVKPDRLFGYFGMEVQNYYQVPGFDGYDPLFIQRYGELLRAADDGRIKLPSTRGVGLGRRAKYTMKLLNLLGGRYVLHAIPDDHYPWAFNFWDYPNQFKLIYEDDKYQVYENLKVFPRAFMAYDYQVIKEPQKIIDQMFAAETNLKETLILEEEPDIKLEKTKKKRGEVKIVRYLPNQIEIELQTETSGLLFLSDNYYPGWKAFVDGEESKIYRADYSFRAVPIPKGKHKVIFVYDPLSFKRGLEITLFSLAALVIINLWLWRSKR